MKKLGLVLIFCCVLSIPVLACTIFVLTDGSRALFFNNEDWSNPRTRIWFVPGGDGRYGAAFVGFDDGYPQGGLNSKGLAFDWVAGFAEEWQRDPSMQTAHGNPTERMFETSATVDEAIAYYHKYWEPGFFRARILVADRTGASAIIGAKDGRLRVERNQQSRGFGYCGERLQAMLAKSPQPTVKNGAAILRACLQPGEFATKYSNVFDLRSGDIFLFDNPERDDSVKVNLAAELAKGGHYYDLPQIRRQLHHPLLPLLTNMKHELLDRVQPIADKEPSITRHLRDVLQAAMAGTVRADDYSPELWKQLSQQEIQSDLKRLGGLVSITLVGRWDEDGKRNYRYRTEFENVTVLQHYVLDEQDKIALLQGEDMELKTR